LALKRLLKRLRMAAVVWLYTSGKKAALLEK
jgi:hypothetical protein